MSCIPAQLGDPMQLLRITGTQAKIHLDPAIAAAGDAKTTMSVSIGTRQLQPVYWLKLLLAVYCTG